VRGYDLELAPSAADADWQSMPACVPDKATPVMAALRPRQQQ
jgi:hypothetical protein